MTQGKKGPGTGTGTGTGTEAPGGTAAFSALPMTMMNNVRVYNITGSAHRSLPDWLARKSARALKQDASWTRRVQLVQDLEFPEASLQAQFTRDGRFLVATGTYRPQFRVFELAEMAMKFERHTDAETTAFELLADDWSRLVLLQANRAIEFHGPSGRHHVVRTPRAGRAMLYDAHACELVVGASDPGVYRLNLDRGQYLAPLQTQQPAGCGVNAVARAPLHGLYALGCEAGGVVEFWDRRERARVAALQLDAPEVTALAFLPDGMTWAAGTSTGLVSLFDLRAPRPLCTRDHHYGLPIRAVRHHPGSGHVLSHDRRALRIWDRASGALLTAIEPGAGAELNHVAFSEDGADGFLLCSVEDRHMQSFFVPALGPAPRWAPFLENLTEEMEEGAAGAFGTARPAPGAVYDNFKFVTRADLAALSLDHLIGTACLRAYMHGFFIDLRLWEKARAIANPFAYDQFRRDQQQAKIDAERATRIRAPPKPPTPAAPKAKVNRLLAERLAKQSDLLAKLDCLDASEGSGPAPAAPAPTKANSKANRKALQSARTSSAILSDARFSALFNNPDFGIDETSPDFRQLHTLAPKPSADDDDDQ